MSIRPPLVILAGAVLVSVGAYAVAQQSAEGFVEPLEEQAGTAIAEAGGGKVTARFTNPIGSPTRHPLLTGGEGLPEATRARVARAVAAIPGVGGIAWSDGTARAESSAPTYEPLHCQEDVDGLLRSRSVRFEEGSSAMQPASRMLLDEVAEALRPCLGAIISITGHTDESGPEPGNLALSMERARAVREALVRRGIPRDGLRAKGVGSSEPVEGLAPGDPANRRIEFAVIRTEPLTPTPVDTPGAR
ncbi:OmpA family protein [Qipengyuania sp. 6B39]|uniref:OmpA family protein n=1 Tax=Qipengyuania proteolytica TaxID=2867239 RepID=UPI001C8A3271|nr:OmpA family protein [Qipengyuania proteolytica]MBX7495298.1 OmpA family protein [Qipengyuania proteolytica]